MKSAFKSVISFRNWQLLAKRFPFFKFDPMMLLLPALILTLFAFFSAINAQSIPGHNRTGNVMASLSRSFEGKPQSMTSALVITDVEEVGASGDPQLSVVLNLFRSHLEGRVLTSQVSAMGAEVSVPYEALIVENTASPHKAIESLMRELADALNETEVGQSIRLVLSVQATTQINSAHTVRWVSALAAQLSYFGLASDRFSVEMLDGPQDIVTFKFHIALMSDEQKGEAA